MDTRVITDPRTLDWIDAGSLMSLPDGVRVKLLSEHKETGIRNFRVRFPPGYREPRHTHKFTHSDVLLEGRWTIEGQEALRGGHICGPAGVPHAPFEGPEGVMVCVSSFGSPIHEWD